MQVDFKTLKEANLDTFLRVLLPGKLAYASGPPKEIMARIKSIGGNIYPISSTMHQSYTPYALDFGPVNLAVVHRFCTALNTKLSKKRDGLCIYCFQDKYQDAANASFLLGAFLVICCEWTPEQAASPFMSPHAPFQLRPFRDPTFANPHKLTLLNCLLGLDKAVRRRWYNHASFDLVSYQSLDDPLSGDIHQICPKLVAFKGPLNHGSPYLVEEEVYLPPEAYTATLTKLGVTCVVRLNEADTYDAEEFRRAGLTHHDLYFDDCTLPSDELVERFLDICDREICIAVHCRAGLGRTGTLIALWMMRNQGFGADDAVGWLRIVRPGSVIGHQQQYLFQCQLRTWVRNRMLPLLSKTSEKELEPPSPEPFPRRPRDPAAPVILAESEMDVRDLAIELTASMSRRGTARTKKAIKT